MIASVVMALALVYAGASSEGCVDDRPLIDPQVRAEIRYGIVRVLVELRVPDDPAGRLTAISRAQDEVLGRLTGGSRRVARRYATLPLLALEIDSAALAQLETMRGLVTSVRVDTLSRPMEGPAGGRSTR